MDELQRQSALRAMGVLPLVASTVLPGAKPSVQIPVLSPVQPVDPKLSLPPVATDRTLANTSATGAGQALEILGADFGTAKKVPVRNISQPQGVVPKTTPDAPAALQFTVVCLGFDNKLGFVVELGDEMPAVATQLCSEIAAVVLAKRDAVLSTNHLFRWPLKQPGLSSGFPAAQDVFRGVLSSQLSSVETVFSMGEIPARLLQLDNAEEFQWMFVQAQRFMKLPGISMLLADPMVKKRLLLSIVAA